MNKYARHKARALVIQALYQWQITGDDFVVLESQFAEYLNPRKVEVDYFKRTLLGCLTHYADLLQLIVVLAQRNAEHLTLVEKSVMLLATYELKFNLDIPYEVVINEALELDKKFGSLDGYRVVNAVLDQAAKQLRKIEYDTYTKKQHRMDKAQN